MRLFVHISYKGTRFSGWQRQSNTGHTVQQIIEEGLTKVLKYKCILSGCGRTDAGVHASTFYFNFDLMQPIEFDLCERMNRLLPADIRFIKTYKVTDRENARFSATSRVYNYFFHFQPNPYINDLSTYVSYELDIASMLEATKIICTQKDFKHFCKQPDKHKTTICQINYIHIYSDRSKKYFRVEISANRFLRGMIRMIMARLFECGRGTFKPEYIKKLFEGTERLILKPAYPQGLFLTEVNYDFIKDEVVSDLVFPHQKQWNLMSS